MSGWSDFFGGASDALGAVGGLLGIGSGIQNMVNAQQDREYQKDLNQTLMDREDSAVQRRAKDLEAAGINKLALLGGGGAASAPLGNATPQVGSPAITGRKGMIEASFNQAMLDNLEAQNANILKQNEKLAAEIGEINKRTESSYNVTDVTMQELRQAQYDLSVELAQYTKDLSASQAAHARAQADAVLRDQEMRAYLNMLNNESRTAIERALTNFAASVAGDAPDSLLSKLGGFVLELLDKGSDGSDPEAAKETVEEYFRRVRREGGYHEGSEVRFTTPEGTERTVRFPHLGHH